MDKNLEVTLLFIEFSKAYSSIEMEQILLAYGLLKEIVTTIIMPYMKAMVHS